MVKSSLEDFDLIVDYRMVKDMVDYRDINSQKRIKEECYFFELLEFEKLK